MGRDNGSWRTPQLTPHDDDSLVVYAANLDLSHVASGRICSNFPRYEEVRFE